MTFSGVVREDLVSFSFRAIHIGTLTTLPSLTLKEKCLEKKIHLPYCFMISPKGIKFNSSAVKMGDILSIKIACKHIQSIESHLNGGDCVIWIKTDLEFAKNITSLCQMTKDGYYYDPACDLSSEQYITVITEQALFSDDHIKALENICQLMAETKNIPPSSFYQPLNAEKCQDRLLKSAERIEKAKLFEENLSDVKSFGIAANDIDIENWEFSSYDTVGNNQKETIRMPDAIGSTKKPTKEIPPVKENITSIPATTLSPDSMQKKVHRARKSIPNRNRSVNIESQLRARLGENEVSKKPKLDAEQATKKRQHSGDSDGSDANSRPSGNDSSSTERIKMLRKKTKTADTTANNSSGPSSPLRDYGDIKASDIPYDETRMSAMNQKSQHIDGTIKTLQQDIHNFMQTGPLCTCVIKSPHTINFNRVREIRCMAMNQIDGRLYGCHNLILRPEMMRPSNKVPVLGLCNEHRERMIRHECCPGCGTFCSSGLFLVCIKNVDSPHRFHKDCMILSGRTVDCPHCGSDINSIKEVNLPSGEEADFLWHLAGKKREKSQMKRYLEQRDKSARMGYAKPVIPQILPDIVEVSKHLSIDLAHLTSLPSKKELTVLIQQIKSEPMKNTKFNDKNFIQLVRIGDFSKVLNMLCSNFSLSEHHTTLNTALHLAIPHDNLGMIHVLVQSGADVNGYNDAGDTPLFTAVAQKNDKLIHYLLVNGADIELKDDEGMMCLHHAAKNGYNDGCYLLMRYGKANVNSLDDGSWTPIVWAAEHKQTDTVRYLIHYNADVTTIDNEGNTCIMWAALSGDVEILSMCLNSHVDIDHQNIHGDTALHIASREDKYVCVNFLLAAGANVNIRNKEGEDALSCTPSSSISWLALKVNQSIRNCVLIRGTKLPLNRERILSKDISRGCDKIPILCVNAYDDAPCPTSVPDGLHYVVDNIHTSQDTSMNLVIPAMQACQCRDNCSTSNCMCGVISERCWYTGAGTLIPEFDVVDPPHIYECNPMCRCDRTCKNRVVQNGIRFRLQVYRTAGMGWGLRAMEHIPRGAFVCDYVGELITDAEADNREDDSYLFDLENKEGDIFCIDARNYGNVSRFINHLCEPNLVPIRVFVNHHDTRFPKLAYFTTREINANEELGFDYGDRFWNVKCKQFTCQCGSINCKYSADAYKKKAEKENNESKQNKNETNGENSK